MPRRQGEEVDRRFLAHVRRVDSAEGTDGKDRDGWLIHDLDSHLRDVGKLASQLAHDIRAADADWAQLAGVWHDLGKYSPAFQARIKRESGYDPEAHVEGSGRVDHSTAGAIHAADKLGAAGRILAYLIAGHHAGLPDWHGDENAGAALSTRLGQRRHVDVLPLSDIPGELLAPGIRPAGKIPGNAAGAHLWMRMLFSCLVDADFLDTEAFMSPEKNEQRGHETSVSELLPRFDAYMARFADIEPTPVNRIRADVLRQCRDKAQLSPGLFSLTVPTGGGKTLASMAFALEHAKAHAQNHPKRRVIYAIPYTSIIEQTANIFRGIFGEAVVEHHSSLDPDKETSKSRLATENWDAPVIVTTNAQLFESLFAAKTSRCRKLHNLAHSVIILDEAQTLPPELLQPCLDALNLLAAHYGISIVLCTATQPALSEVTSFGRNLRGLDNVREIIEAPQTLFDSLQRVSVELPADFHARRDWDSLAAEIGSHDSVLAIVNTRADCRELWLRLPKGTIHLSASMCGAHRAKCIATINARLKAKEAVRVVSTQLIEAGVDVDFPVVYRALAGLDSVAQAAGRCNREGRLESGRVVVFVPPKAAPAGQLRRAEQTTVSLMTGTNLDPLAPASFRRYFKHFYLDAPSWDKYGMENLLAQDAGRIEIQFRTASQKFRYVDDADSMAILVWWADGEINSRSLIGKLEKDGPERWLMRKLQRHAVNLPRPVAEKLIETGEVREVWPGIFAQDVDTLYHPDRGIDPDNDDPLVF